MDAGRVGDEIRKAIISTVGGLDAPMSPDEKGAVSTARYLSGVTEAEVQQRRDEVLGTSADDLDAFAAAAERVQREGRVVVVSSEAGFAQYHEAHRGKPMFELLRPLQGKGAGGGGGGGGGSGALA